MKRSGHSSNHHGYPGTVFGPGYGIPQGTQHGHQSSTVVVDNHHSHGSQIPVVHHHDRGNPMPKEHHHEHNSYDEHHSHFPK